MKTSLGYAVLLSKFEAFEYKQNGGILQGGNNGEWGMGKKAGERRKKDCLPGMSGLCGVPGTTGKATIHPP
jgi:hypothetical protein